MFFKIHVVSSLYFSLSSSTLPFILPLFFLPSFFFPVIQPEVSIYHPKLHADILSFLGSINKFLRSRASCPQYHSHSEWCLFTELSIWAVVAANVYLQLVGASVKLFALLGGSISWTVVQETLEFCFFILRSASSLPQMWKIIYWKLWRL